MNVPLHKRLEYWNHFITQWTLHLGPRPYGVTGQKLAKIKMSIMADNEFWQDVVWRHNGMNKRPDEMALSDEFTYAHCEGNFWGMVMQTLVEKGLVR